MIYVLLVIGAFVLGIVVAVVAVEALFMSAFRR